MIYDIALAIGPFREFGNKKGLPWPRLPRDMSFFKELSKEYDYIICGNSTFKTLPESYKKGKQFLVLSINSSLDGTSEAKDYEVTHIKLDKGNTRSLCDLIQGDDAVGLFIGGAYLLNNMTFILPEARNIYVTHVSGKAFEADTFIDTAVLDYLEQERFSTMHLPIIEESAGIYSGIKRFW